MTALAIFLLIAGWLLAYTGFTEPNGDVRKEIAEALGGSSSKTAVRGTQKAPATRERRGGA